MALLRSAPITSLSTGQPLGRFDHLVCCLHGPTQTERKRTVVMVHGIEFGLFCAINPVPFLRRFPKKVRDF